VGTVIDFEGGITACLAGIAAEAGVAIDGEEALALYRHARYMPGVGLFPDDLVRVYMVIAPRLGLPAEEKYGVRLRDSASVWKGFPDSAAALADLAKSHKL
ncbi:hydrolase, partial [Mesorhizobium sp. M2E.F.Ca.ET.209.01.1.1]